MLLHAIKYRLAATLIAFTFSTPFLALAQDEEPKPVPLSDSIVNRIPVDYRDQVRQIKMRADSQAYYEKQSDDELTTEMFREISGKPEGARFLLVQLEKESSGRIRTEIINSMSRYWASHPESQQTLQHFVESDPDAGVSVAALGQLRKIRIGDLGKLLDARIQTATKSNDATGLGKLSDEKNLEYDWFSGALLPTFMDVPPPTFSVVPAGKSIRVLAFGDFGTGSDQQISVAKAMVRYNKEHPFDFGLTLGDNFYGAGMESPSDPRWQTQWEQLYGPMGIKFYATLGNHDYGLKNSPAAEILYSQKSPTWRMPAPYYTFTAGAVQFFAFDTVNLSVAELEWLDKALSESKATWKVVYGHYQIYSATRGDNKELIDRLLPILKKDNVDVWINGHDHNLQELKADGSLHFFVSGGGGAGLYDMTPYPRSVFRKKLAGFSVIEADATHLKVSFIGDDGKELYNNDLHK
jgi:hypothetical protein